MIFVIGLCLLGCTANKSLLHEDITSQATCAEKDGYWYNNKCWTAFDDDGISKANIDEEVDNQMKIINQSKVKVNDKEYPLTFFFPEEGRRIILITIFGEKNNEQTLLQFIKPKMLKKKEFDMKATLFQGSLLEIPDTSQPVTIAQGKLHATINDFEALDINFSGTLKNDSDETFEIAYQPNEVITGAGTSNIEVKGDEAFLNGDLGTKTYQQIKNLIKNHPEVKTLVLGNISGSLNDAVNMHTGRIVREAGLNTKVLSNSSIASGGVDLFCAGQERIVEKGAKIGIHSWCCLDDLTAVEIPQDHPAHKYQVAFFKMCLGEELGPRFYFHTLTAASFDSVHWMSDEDIKKWKVATQFVE